MQLFSFHVFPLKSLKHHNLSVTLIHFACWSHCVWSRICISQGVCVVSVSKLMFWLSQQGSNQLETEQTQKHVATFRFFSWPLFSWIFFSRLLCLQVFFSFLRAFTSHFCELSRSKSQINLSLFTFMGFPSSSICLPRVNNDSAKDTVKLSK